MRAAWRMHLQTNRFETRKEIIIMNFTLILTHTSSEWRIVTKRDVNLNTGTDHSIITHKLIGMCEVHKISLFTCIRIAAPNDGQDGNV